MGVDFIVGSIERCLRELVVGVVVGGLWALMRHGGRSILVEGGEIAPHVLSL